MTNSDDCRSSSNRNKQKKIRDGDDNDGSRVAWWVPRTVKVLSVVVYLAIFSVLSLSLVKGPISKFYKNDTHLIVDFVDAESLGGRVYPTIAICQFPGYRHVNPFKYPHMPKEAEGNFSGFLRNEYFEKASDMLRFFSLGGAIYHGHVYSAEELDEFARPFETDCNRFAVCFALDTNEIIRDFEARFLNASAAEGTFTYTFSLAFLSDNVYQPEDSLTYPSYHSYIIDQDEELMLSGSTNTRTTADNYYVTCPPGRIFMYNVDVELRQNIRNCDLSNRKLSACVAGDLRRRFGPCNVSDAEVKEACPYSVVREKCLEADRLKIEGMTYTTATSGCLLPCERFVYITSLVFSNHVSKVIYDIDAFSHLPKETAMTIIRLPRARKVKRVREERNYPLSTLVAEVGGYMGLFLGLSFWGVYSVMCAVAKKLTKFANRGKRRKKKKADPEEVNGGVGGNTGDDVEETGLTALEQEVNTRP